MLRHTHTRTLPGLSMVEDMWDELKISTTNTNGRAFSPCCGRAHQFDLGSHRFRMVKACRRTAHLAFSLQIFDGAALTWGVTAT